MLKMNAIMNLFMKINRGFNKLLIYKVQIGLTLLNFSVNINKSVN